MDSRARASRVKAPSGLSPRSRRLFAQLVLEYGITDQGGRAILHSGLVALDRAVEAEAAIAKDGLTTRDRWGQVKAHPLLPVVRDCRAAWLASLRALNLQVGDPPKVGRPGADEEWS